MLYKYFGNLDFAEAVIKNSQVHLELPSDYNDIYDSSLRIDEDGLCTVMGPFATFCDLLWNVSEGKYQKSLIAARKIVADNPYLIQKGFSLYHMVDLQHRINEHLDKKELERDCISVLGNQAIVQDDSAKITCFSERWDSLLMWAYYAKSYSGVCLGFDTSGDSKLWDDCQKVQYSKYFLPDVGTWENYFRKSEEWSHEQEWRIAVITDKEFLAVNRPSCIILGPRMSRDDRDRIILLAKQYEIQVYELVQSNREYKLERRMLHDFSLPEVDSEEEKIRNIVNENLEDYIFPAKT